MFSELRFFIVIQGWAELKRSAIEGWGRWAGKPRVTERLIRSTVN